MHLHAIRARGKTRALSLSVVAAVAWGAAAMAQSARAATLATCDRWAVIAASEHRVPERLMLAITRVETGLARSGAPDAARQPMPWAVNANGDQRWFETRLEAVAFAHAQLGAGGTHIDIGCFQLNSKWHGRAFASLDEMIEPARNARYAARFLAALHAEFGDWTSATAAYHSRTPALGQAYVKRIAEELESLPLTHTLGLNVDAAASEDRFPRPPAAPLVPPMGPAPDANPMPGSLFRGANAGLNPLASLSGS